MQIRFALWTVLCISLNPYSQSQWMQVQRFGKDTSVTAVAVNGPTLLTAVYRVGVFRSTDYGSSWKVVQGIPLTAVRAFLVNGAVALAGTDVGVYRSTDNGSSWIWVNNGYTPSGYVYALAGSGGNVFAGTEGNGIGVFRSTDDGLTWSPSGNGLVNPGVKGVAVGSSTIWAATDGGVSRSTSNGLEWITANDGLTSANHVAHLCVATNDTNTFVGTEGDGIFLSTNNGGNWTSVNPGLEGMVVRSIVISGSKTFAGTSMGVYLFDKSHRSWELVSAPFFVEKLAVGNSDLFVATYGSGLWRRPLSEMITSMEAQSLGAGTIRPRLGQNYPNPFNPSTTIIYELQTSSDVRISVFDLLGREVSVLVNERRDAGLHEVKFDSSNLASGVYFCRLRVGDFVQSRKLLLSR